MNIKPNINPINPIIRHIIDRIGSWFLVCIPAISRIIPDRNTPTPTNIDTNVMLNIGNNMNINPSIISSIGIVLFSAISFFPTI